MGVTKMRRSVVAIPLSVALVLAIVLLGSSLGSDGGNHAAAGATASAPAGAIAPTPAVPDPVMPPGASQDAPGIPAIPVTAAVGDNVPTFSAADVAAYLNTYPPLHWNPATPLPIVEAIEFLSVSDTETRLRTTLYRPKDELVGLVTLKGSFVVSGPSVPGRNGPAFTSNTEYLVFGAHSGNLLQIITPE